MDLLNVDSDTLDGNDSPYYLDYTNFTNTPFIPATTDDITEATNLYYTEARVDANIATKTTDDLSEGTNLYYTDARAQAAITGGTGVDVTAGTVSIGQGVDPTDNVTFNDVIVDGDLTVNGTTTSVNSNEVDIGDNIILLNSNETGAPTQDAGISIERGTSANVQLVWDETSDRWTVGTEDFVAANFIGDVTGQVSDISNHSTTNLTEGTNLYYTDTRVNADIDGRVDKAFVDALNVDSDTLDNQQGTYYLDYNNFTNTPSIPATTNDISEGTNLYFTDERVDDRVNNLIQGGSGITVTYNDAAGTLTIESLVSGYGSADFDTDFASNTTTDLTEGTNLYYTNERVDDRVANLLVGGNNITVTYNDTAGTLTVDGQPGYTTSDFSTDFANKTTTDLTEGSKLYYTQGRFDSAFGVKTTSNLTEGSNLYYTTARANSAVDSRVTKTFVDNLNVDAGTLDGINGSQFLRNDQSGTINGDFTVSGGTGPVVFTVVADSDNNNESDTALIRLSQDGGIVTGTWGIDDNNDMYFASEYGGTDIDFRTSGGGVTKVNGSRLFADNYHPNADKLTTARTISLGGDVTGSASFDGSSSISITATVGNDSHSHSYTNLTNKPTIPSTLTSLTNVSAASPSTDQVLQWNGSAWVAATIATSTPNSTSTTVGGFTSRYDAASNTLFLRGDGGTA